MPRGAPDGAPGSAPLPPGFPNVPPGPAPAIAPSPIQPAVPPYLAGRTGPRAGRPIEPWKDSLRLQMFIWGGLLLLAFLTPTAIDPDLKFNWDRIIDGEGTQKLGPLILAAVGLLSIVLATIPTSPMPRGLLAGSLGLLGILVPLLIGMFAGKGDFGLTQILLLATFVGLMLLITGLLIRNEYRESILPRLFVTIGVLCVLASYLIPINDNIQLVAIFEAIIDGPGKVKVSAILNLLPIVYAVISLLVWLPAPSTGAGIVMAWLWITLLPLQQLAALLVRGHIGEQLKASPFDALMSWAPMTGYLVLLGYGFATVIGKKLE
jgi:hypothetical protein